MQNDIFLTPEFISDVIQRTSDKLYFHNVLEHYINNFSEISKKIIMEICFNDNHNVTSELLRYINLHKLCSGRKCYSQYMGENEVIFSYENYKRLRVDYFIDGRDQNILSTLSKKFKVNNNEPLSVIHIMTRDVIMSEKEYAKWKLVNG